MERPRLRDVLCICLVAVSVDGMIAAYIGTNNPSYFHDYRQMSNPDAQHFVILGRNIWQGGVFSRMDGPPYTPDYFRTPVYPVVAGGLEMVAGGVWGVFAVQATCRALLAVTVYALGVFVFGRVVALLAGILIASDLSLAVLDFQAMSECLFGLFATTGILLWLRCFANPARLGIAMAIGVLLGLATLTRPSSLYLPLVLGGGWAVLSLVHRNVRHLAGAGILVVIYVASIVPWIARNVAVFGVYRLSPSDCSNLIYSAGAGAYAVEQGVTWSEAQELIRQEYGIISFRQCNNMWTVDRSVRELDAELRAVTSKVLWKYPRSLTISTITGIGKSLVSHNVADLAEMGGREWHPPGLSTALRGDWPAFIASLRRNDAILTVAFIWEVLLAAGVAILAIVGSIVGLVQKTSRWFTLGLLLVCGYYLATIGVVGLDAYSRHRSMLTPLLVIMAAMAVKWAYHSFPAVCHISPRSQPGATAS